MVFEKMLRLRRSSALAYQLEQAMKKQGVSQAEMARRMKTSRTVVRRLLDSEDTSVTLATLTRASMAVGERLQLALTH